MQRKNSLLKNQLKMSQIPQMQSRIPRSCSQTAFRKKIGKLLNIQPQRDEKNEFIKVNELKEQNRYKLFGELKSMRIKTNLISTIVPKPQVKDQNGQLKINKVNKQKIQERQIINDKLIIQREQKDKFIIQREKMIESTDYQQKIKQKQNIKQKDNNEAQNKGQIKQDKKIQNISGDGLKKEKDENENDGQKIQNEIIKQNQQQKQEQKQIEQKNRNEAQEQKNRNEAQEQKNRNEAQEQKNRNEAQEQNNRNEAQEQNKRNEAQEQNKRNEAQEQNKRNEAQEYNKRNGAEKEIIIQKNTIQQNNSKVCLLILVLFIAVLLVISYYFVYPKFKELVINNQFLPQYLELNRQVHDLNEKLKQINDQRSASQNNMRNAFKAAMRYCEILRHNLMKPLEPYQFNQTQIIQYQVLISIYQTYQSKEGLSNIPNNFSLQSIEELQNYNKKLQQNIQLHTNYPKQYNIIQSLRTSISLLQKQNEVLKRQNQILQQRGQEYLSLQSLTDSQKNFIKKLQQDIIILKNQKQQLIQERKKLRDLELNKEVLEFQNNLYRSNLKEIKENQKTKISNIKVKRIIKYQVSE